MFESLTVTTLLLVLFFFYQNMALGLTSTVPKDSHNRMRYFCSECLTSLKQLLAGSTVHELETERLTFVSAGQQSLMTLSLQDSKVMFEGADQQRKPLHSLGDQGSLMFEQLSENGLMVTIEARSGEAAHKIAVRLETQFLPQTRTLD